MVGDPTKWFLHCALTNLTVTLSLKRNNKFIFFLQLNDSPRCLEPLTVFRIDTSLIDYRENEFILINH